MTIKSTLRRMLRNLALRLPPVQRLHRDHQRLHAECAILRGERDGLKATLAALQARYMQLRGEEIAASQQAPQIMVVRASEAPILNQTSQPPPA